MQCRVYRRSVFLAAAMVVLVGCSRLGRYVVQVQSGSATDSIQVDIVGVNDAEYERWAAYPLDEYWSPTNAFRKNAVDRVVLRFGMGREPVQQIGRKDPCWTAWRARQCRYLFVLTNAGPLRSAEAAVVDPRRLVLPLEKKRWDGRTIQVQVQPGGIVCVNGPRPKK